MKPLNMTAILLMASTFGPVSQVCGINLAEGSGLQSWLAGNRTFIDAQFEYIGLPIDAGYEADVMTYVTRYLQPGRAETERMLGRADYYLPIFERALAAYGLPDGLKYLPIVESGLYPRITSPAGATGLWQFMPATARHFDLEIGKWIDERHDPYRASEAAAQLLSYLYEQFQDWSLALVAYNCGPGCVQKAIKQAGSRHYAAIRPFLPKQTQRYIAKYKAAAYVAVFHEFFGITPRPASLLPADAVRITVYRELPLSEAARLANIPLAMVRALNPAYAQGIIPARSEGCALVLPAEAAAILQQRLTEEAGGEPEIETTAPREELPVAAIAIESDSSLPQAMTLKSRNSPALATSPRPFPGKPKSQNQHEDMIALYQRELWRTVQRTTNN